MIRNDPRIRQVDIAAGTGMSLSTVRRIISDLRSSGVLSRDGNDRSGSWAIKE